MKIKIAKEHYLNSDPQCYWITRERKNKKGDVVEKRVSGYYRTIGLVVANLAEAKIRQSDANTIEELKAVVSSIQSLVQEIKETDWEEIRKKT